MDRRQRRTRDAIFAAFTKLLEEKPYSAMTVQEIIDAANVGRSTFYAHFETKDALIRALCTEIIDHVFSHETGREPGHDFTGVARDVESELTHVLYHIQESRSYLAGLLRSSSGELFMRELRERIAEAFSEEIGLAAEREGIPQDYLANHISCDFTETVRWWMQAPQYSPEEVCGFFLATTRL